MGDGVTMGFLTVMPAFFVLFFIVAFLSLFTKYFTEEKNYCS